MFEYIPTPFGLSNAAHTFQRFIYQVVRGVTFTFPYMDDILVFSENQKDHADHLHQLFACHGDNRLFLNPTKCALGVERLNVLGHRVDGQSIHLLPQV